MQSVTKEGEAISAVTLTDGTNDFRLLFNNYIGYSDESSPDITTFVEEGAEISAVGVIYKDPEACACGCGTCPRWNGWRTSPASPRILLCPRTPTCR